MSNQSLYPIEKEAIRAILESEAKDDETLLQQLQSCFVIERSLSGVGFFTEISVDSQSVPSPHIKKAALGKRVTIQMDGLKNGGGFVLFIEHGFLKMLEGYSYDEPWPTEIKNFSISVLPE